MTVVIDRKGPVSVADRARAKNEAPTGLYKPRVPIYPKNTRGPWRTIKWALLIATLAVYYVTPWIRFDRPGDLPDQAVLVDFEHGRFYFFWIHLWPQEVFFVTGLLVMAALGLFLVSAMFGRLWCGYACPQTVWTDLFLFVERVFEGERNAHMRRDQGPLTFEKVWRKTAKHAFWLAVAFATGGAWIFYFRDAPTLLREFWMGQAPMTSYVSCALLTFTTYVFAGHMREQVCEYLCPWPRIQSAMVDAETLQVTYRYDRGEPRGPHKKGATWEGRGDCIDCNACVVVCPMGIDIRNGPQLECINCGLCIDACNEMMARIERPRNLIAFDTDQAVKARSEGQQPKYRLFRTRTQFYAVLLGVVSVLMIWGLITRPSADLHLLHDRNPTFVRLADGSVRNGYTLKITNRQFEARRFVLSVEGLPGLELRMVGGPSGSTIAIDAPADAVRTARLFVIAPPGTATSEETPLTFRLSGADVSGRSTFLVSRDDLP
ncbi:MAG: cytochrome c oxidase accessory protein CcoG [Caulobacteraceae bacterium]